MAIHYSGRVQGVGFRFQTRQIAKEFDVSGYVENLPDGRVRIEVEGEEREVRAFKGELDEQMASFIRESESSEQMRVGEFEGFQIRR